MLVLIFVILLQSVDSFHFCEFHANTDIVLFVCCSSQCCGVELNKVHCGVNHRLQMEKHTNTQTSMQQPVSLFQPGCYIHQHLHAFMLYKFCMLFFIDCMLLSCYACSLWEFSLLACSCVILCELQSCHCLDCFGGGFCLFIFEVR